MSAFSTNLFFYECFKKFREIIQFLSVSLFFKPIGTFPSGHNYDCVFVSFDLDQILFQIIGALRIFDLLIKSFSYLNAFTQVQY